MKKFNVWKVAFFVCFALLFCAIYFLMYILIDRGTTLTYRQQALEWANDDLSLITHMYNSRSYTKEEITEILRTDSSFIYDDFNEDTIAIHWMTLYFENDTLVKIAEQ